MFECMSLTVFSLHGKDQDAKDAEVKVIDLLHGVHVRRGA